ncbi:MAG: phosphoenolpyruvate--protein phosphotransferase [Fimbriiglobus sp.]|nr:phosphoenolpyruvate--protein phosphotransferase [Fimbriiglobus sp.]
MHVRRGIAVCPGIAIGPALVLDTEGVRIPSQVVPHEQVMAEGIRLRQAVDEALRQSAERQRELTRKHGRVVGEIFEAKSGLFEDGKLIGGIEGLIRAHDYSAEYAVSRHVRGILKQLDAAAHVPQAARLRGDYVDFERQLLEILRGGRREPLAELDEAVVILANDLTPSETAELDPKLVFALATESGGSTSHTAILAGALEIPAVVGVGRFLTDVSGGDRVIIDGNNGLVILDPDDATVERYEKARRLERSRSGEHRVQSRNVPAVTRDGVRITLLGNIEFPSETRPCLDRGAEGVGLYRTEFLYIHKGHDPSEEEHYQAYKAVLTELGPDRPVVIRTLDLGGDKFTHSAAGYNTQEKNPFLGLRSVRLCLRNLPLFKTQLRAILRASVHGDVRVMFPMISTVMELRQCKGILREVQEDLEEARIPFKPDVPVGTMIEVPSAALIADLLAKQVNFFSIGTNDLVQYTLAADRNNESVADLYSAADPSILRLIDRVTKSAAAAGVAVNVCGEMSGEPMFAPLLLGLGVRQLSATPRKIPDIKRVVRAVALPDCQKLAAECLELETASEVTRYLRDHLRRVLPDADD